MSDILEENLSTEQQDKTLSQVVDKKYLKKFWDHSKDIPNQVNYSSLDTTAKKVVGAINEVDGNTREDEVKKTYERVTVETVTSNADDSRFVDLGLPSGKLWAKEDFVPTSINYYYDSLPSSGFISQDHYGQVIDAGYYWSFDSDMVTSSNSDLIFADSANLAKLEDYGDYPTLADFIELLENTTQSYSGSVLTLTSKTNGNSITFTVSTDEEESANTPGSGYTYPYNEHCYLTKNWIETGSSNIYPYVMVLGRANETSMPSAPYFIVFPDNNMVYRPDGFEYQWDHLHMRTVLQVVETVTRTTEIQVTDTTTTENILHKNNTSKHVTDRERFDWNDGIYEETGINIGGRKWSDPLSGLYYPGKNQAYCQLDDYLDEVDETNNFNNSTRCAQFILSSEDYQILNNTYIDETDSVDEWYQTLVNRWLDIYPDYYPTYGETYEYEGDEYTFLVKPDMDVMYSYTSQDGGSFQGTDKDPMVQFDGKTPSVADWQALMKDAEYSLTYDDNYTYLTVSKDGGEVTFPIFAYSNYYSYPIVYMTSDFEPLPDNNIDYNTFTYDGWNSYGDGDDYIKAFTPNCPYFLLRTFNGTTEINGVETDLFGDFYSESGNWDEETGSATPTFDLTDPYLTEAPTDTESEEYAYYMSIKSVIDVINLIKPTDDDPTWKMGKWITGNVEHYGEITFMWIPPGTPRTTGSGCNNTIFGRLDYSGTNSSYIIVKNPNFNDEYSYYQNLSYIGEYPSNYYDSTDSNYGGIMPLSLDDDNDTPSITGGFRVNPDYTGRFLIAQKFLYEKDGVKYYADDYWTAYDYYNKFGTYPDVNSWTDPIDLGDGITRRYFVTYGSNSDLNLSNVDGGQLRYMVQNLTNGEYNGILVYLNENYQQLYTPFATNMVVMAGRSGGYGSGMYSNLSPSDNVFLIDSYEPSGDDGMSTIDTYLLVGNVNNYYSANNSNSNYTLLRNLPKAILPLINGEKILHRENGEKHLTMKQVKAEMMPPIENMIGDLSYFNLKGHLVQLSQLAKSCKIFSSFSDLQSGNNNTVYYYSGTLPSGFTGVSELSLSGIWIATKTTLGYCQGESVRDSEGNYIGNNSPINTTYYNYTATKYELYYFPNDSNGKRYRKWELLYRYGNENWLEVATKNYIPLTADDAEDIFNEIFE